MVHFLSGSPCNLQSNFRKDTEGGDGQGIIRRIISFMIRLFGFLYGLRTIIQRCQNSNPPSNCVREAGVGQAIPTSFPQDHIIPCIQRLQRLEKTFEELSSKPAHIPLEKEQMLLNSIDRIKSVEYDLEKTKKVKSATACQLNILFKF